MRVLICKSASLVLACVLFSCTEKSVSVRIVFPDDTCGLLAGYMSREKNFAGEQRKQESIPMMDCCSTTAEWALSSDNVDVAWLCPDAAGNLLSKDKRFVIIGPALVNSQVLVLRKGVKPARIAYSHKREYLRRHILKRYGAQCEAIPVMPGALPYLYAQGSVDGIVIDVLRAVYLDGECTRLPENGHDVVTYVLLVSKEFRGSESFPLFLADLKKAVDALNDELNNEGICPVLTGKDKMLSPVQLKKILSLGVRFIPPPDVLEKVTQ